jgi:hypothetical protein
MKQGTIDQIETRHNRLNLKYSPFLVVAHAQSFFRGDYSRSLVQLSPRSYWHFRFCMKGNNEAIVMRMFSK